MKKRLLSLLMIMAMVIALLPAIPAGAAEAAISWPSVGQPVTIGGKSYTYMGDTAGGLDFVAYDEQAVAFTDGEGGYLLYDGDRTVTLHNVYLTESKGYDDIDAVLGVHNGWIVLEGENVIDVMMDSCLAGIGLYLYGGDTDDTRYSAITGDGSLEINVEHYGNPEHGGDYDIYREYAAIGLLCEDALWIEDAKLDILADSYDGEGAYSLFCSDHLWATNAKLDLEAWADAYSCPLTAMGDAYFEDCTLLGESDGCYNSDMVVDFLDAFNFWADAELVGSVLKAKVSADELTTDEFYALYSNGTLRMEDSAAIIEFGNHASAMEQCEAVSAERIELVRSFVQANKGWMAGWESFDLYDTYVARPTGATIEEADQFGGEVLLDQNGEYADGGMISPAAYTDVFAEDWFAPAAGFTKATGLFQGTGADTFSPTMQMTRAMMMVALARMNGADTTPAAGQSWYEKGRQWAMENGVSDGTNPNNVITREQLACMIWKLEGQPSAEITILDNFADGDATSDWAVEGLAWAVSKGIMNGKGEGKLDPLATATRSEVAQLMLNYATMQSTIYDPLP